MNLGFYPLRVIDGRVYQSLMGFAFFSFLHLLFHWKWFICIIHLMRVFIRSPHVPYQFSSFSLHFPPFINAQLSLMGTGSRLPARQTSDASEAF